MTKFEKIAVVAFAGTALFFAGWLSGGEHVRRNIVSPDNMISSDTTTVRTAIQDTPVLTDSAAVGRINTIIVPVIRSDPKTPPKPPVLPVIVVDADSTDATDSVAVVPDSARVLLPEMEKIYETENYRAVVTGYNPKLSDITIYAPTRTVTNKYVDTKRWRLTIGAQVGYGITPAGMQPYAGVGFTFGYTF